MYLPKAETIARELVRSTGRLNKSIERVVDEGAESIDRRGVD